MAPGQAIEHWRGSWSTPLVSYRPSAQPVDDHGFAFFQALKNHAGYVSGRRPVTVGPLRAFFIFRSTGISISSRE